MVIYMCDFSWEIGANNFSPQTGHDWETKEIISSKYSFGNQCWGHNLQKNCDLDRYIAIKSPTPSWLAIYENLSLEFLSSLQEVPLAVVGCLYKLSDGDGNLVSCLGMLLMNSSLLPSSILCVCVIA